MPALAYDFTKFKIYKNINIDNVIIPTTDDVAWEFFPSDRWIYNKLDLSEINKIPCGPAGTYPNKYPVVVKPMMNLFSGGYGSRKIDTKEELEKYLLPGYFWMKWLKGTHLSYDIVVKDGNPVWIETFQGHKLRDGMFDYWETISSEVSSKQINKIVDWTISHLPEYTGCLCCETINDQMIEAHLRMGDIDRFMNLDLMQNIVNIYKGKEWQYFKGYKKFFLFALFAPYNQEIVFDSKILKKIKHESIFFQLDRNTTLLCNPPSGKRIAILGAYDKTLCIDLRNLLINNAQPTIMNEYVGSLLGYKNT